MDIRTRPTLEQLSVAAELPDDLPVLAKSLLLTTDDAPETDRDLEGLVVLSPHSCSSSPTMISVSRMLARDFGVSSWRPHFT